MTTCHMYKIYTLICFNIHWCKPHRLWSDITIALQPECSHIEHNHPFVKSVERSNQAMKSLICICCIHLKEKISPLSVTRIILSLKRQDKLEKSAQGIPHKDEKDDTKLQNSLLAQIYVSMATPDYKSDEPLFLKQHYFNYS